MYETFKSKKITIYCRSSMPPNVDGTDIEHRKLIMERLFGDVSMDYESWFLIDWMRRRWRYWHLVAYIRFKFNTVSELRINHLFTVIREYLLSRLYKSGHLCPNRSVVWLAHITLFVIWWCAIRSFNGNISILPDPWESLDKYWILLLLTLFFHILSWLTANIILALRR